MEGNDKILLISDDNGEEMSKRFSNMIMGDENIELVSSSSGIDDLKSNMRGIMPSFSSTMTIWMQTSMNWLI